MKKGTGALVLFSGGLDSMLAVRLLREQGIGVEALHFTCPFYSSRWARKGAAMLGVKLHEVPVDGAYFRMVSGPGHGYGSQMNPCIDCKIYMFRRAERLRKSLNSTRRSLRERAGNLDFLATGEVVGERPLSQTRQAMMMIEKEADLSGRVVRPLSAGIMPETRAEKKGVVDRTLLASISGRSRKPQMELARKYGIREYPAPAGGCLLTDPEYARRLRGLLRQRGRVTWDEGEMLKHGRHFVVGDHRIVVGRHEKDNEELLVLASKMGLARLEVVGHPGPLTVVLPKGRAGRAGKELLVLATRLTVRYSDVPAGEKASVEVRKGRSREVMEVTGIGEKDLERMRS